ncbi:MAG: hypothetical protein OJF61_001540 [Rhodanobacteraceae bacterium]|jgi:hypothetical protein|nr:MAG: hypothetical protein OJF61_001540 [Rhodanobacteraceae bacterium]
MRLRANASRADGRMASLSFFARLPGGRATFLCVAKERWPKERPPRCCAFRPSMDERCDRTDRACRRAIPGAAASGRNPLRPPCGPDRPVLTAAQGPQIRFDDGHPGLARSKTTQSALQQQRAGCAPNGAPRTRRAGDGKVRRMARGMRASSPQAQGCAIGEPRRPLANPEHRDVLRTCSRGGLLFTPGVLPSALRAAFGVLARSRRASGDFLLATQEKVTRAPGLNRQDCRFERRRRPEGRVPWVARVRGAKKDRDVVVIPPPLRGDPLPSEGGDCEIAGAGGRSAGSRRRRAA